MDRNNDNSIMEDMMKPASAPVVENAEYVEVTTAEPEKPDALLNSLAYPARLKQYCL